MLYSEIIAVCSEIHTKHISTLCGQNVELMNVKSRKRIASTPYADAVASPVCCYFQTVSRQDFMFNSAMFRRNFVLDADTCWEPHTGVVVPLTCGNFKFKENVARTAVC
jgi:hypothetical protein